MSFWQTKGYLLQLLPLAENGDLHMLWKRVKKFPIETVAHVAAELGTALVHIHDNKIVYRDLKMENILISQVRFIHYKASQKVPQMNPDLVRFGCIPSLLSSAIVAASPFSHNDPQ